MPPIIRVEALTKTFKVYRNHQGYFGIIRNLFNRKYNIIKAVSQISFQINRGELVGYIGPNGAGKSTTIKMLTGLLVPTTGQIEVAGFIPWKERKTYVQRIGVVFGQRTTLWWDLPLTDSFDLIQHIYHIPDTRFKENMGLFREILALDDFIKVPVRSLSLGQRMRADICAALLHDPELVFLDEPTIGLDVVAKEKIRAFIQYLNEVRKTTILLTTHDLADVQKLCERVIIIDRGKILYDDSLTKLLRTFGGQRTLLVDFAEPYPNPALQGADIIKKSGYRVYYQFDRKNISASKLINQLSKKYRISDLEVRDQPIEDTIRNIYEGQLLYQSHHAKKNSSS